MQVVKSQMKSLNIVRNNRAIFIYSFTPAKTCLVFFQQPYTALIIQMKMHTYAAEQV